MKNRIEPWHGDVPPGVPGAGWFIATIFVLSVIVLTGWEQGWWEGGHNNTAAAPAASHHTTGSGNRAPQEPAKDH